MLLNVILLVIAVIGLVASILTIIDRLPPWFGKGVALWVMASVFFVFVLLTAYLSFENRNLRDTQKAAEAVATKYEARNINFYNDGQLGEIMGAAIAVSGQMGACHKAYNESLARQVEELPPQPKSEDKRLLAGIGLGFLEGVADGLIKTCD